MPRISKSEWQQVSQVAAGLDWSRISLQKQHDVAVAAGLNDRTAAALQQLLRVVAS